VCAYFFSKSCSKERKVCLLLSVDEKLERLALPHLHRSSTGKEEMSSCYETKVEKFVVILLLLYRKDQSSYQLGYLKKLDGSCYLRS